jgi:hypothetical protein
MPPIRCAPYYRVSHKDELRGISIDVQRETVELIAGSQGWCSSSRISTTARARSPRTWRSGQLCRVCWRYNPNLIGSVRPMPKEE